jgi:uncharacterized protein (DUF433 family)
MEEPLIEADPKIMVGKPVIKGTRITVEHILEEMSGGMTIDDLLDAHPHITRQDVQAALRFAAESVRYDRVYPARQEQEPLIISNPNVMVGKPVIWGTRITVDLILQKLAAGQMVEQILEDYPHLSREDIKAALEFAAESVSFIRANPTDQASI